MTRDDIKILLIKKRTSFYKIARELEVAPNYVYEIINSHRNSPVVVPALERILGLSIADIRSAWANQGGKK